MTERTETALPTLESVKMAIPEALDEARWRWPRNSDRALCWFIAAIGLVAAMPDADDVEWAKMALNGEEVADVNEHEQARQPKTAQP